MKEVINFILENYRLIADVIAVIVAVVFFLIRKKPVKVVDTLKQLLTSWLPGVIASAENTDLKGKAKLEYALELLYNLFAKDYLTLDEFNNKYRDYLIGQIEAILYCPQKKKGE